MTAEDTDEEDEYEADVLPAKKYSWVDTAGICLGFVHNMCYATTVFFHTLCEQVAQHSAYKTQGKDFAESVLADIKRL